MKVPKWREDAIRKSRRQEEMQEFSRKRRGDDANSGDGPGEKKRRKKRFKAICDELYEKSLSK